MSRDCPVCRGGEGRLCGPCRAAPENVDWVDATEEPTGREPRGPVLWGREAREFSPTVREVAMGLVLGKSEREIARAAGVSRARVREIARELLS